MRALVVTTALLFFALVVAPAVADGALAWGGSFGIDRFGSPGIEGLSCPATNQCTLVDQSGQEVTFNPTTPGAATPVDIDGDNSFTVVHCPTTSQCTAVDVYGTEFTFNPTAANVSATITSVAVQTGNGPTIKLACFSTTECTTVSGTGIEATFNPATGAITKAATTIDASNGGDVYGLSCPTAAQCTEVDDAGDEVTFNPTTAMVVRDSGVGSYTTYGVACPTSGQCTAVNGDGQELTFAPTSGTVSRTASIDGTSFLDSVACPNSGECTATDDDGNEITFDPTSGSVGSTTLISVTSAGAVSCPSASQCTAVGGFDGSEYTLTGIGTGAIREETGVVDGGEPLNAVACSAVTQCSAVDNQGYEVTFDPLSQSVVNSVLLVSGDYLTDVACDGTAQCTAVDGFGFETTFTPSTGAITESVKVNGGSQINGVACPAANQCTGVDDGGYETTFNPASGAVVSSTRLFTSAGNSGKSVDCPSLTQCTAVSHDGDAATFNPQSGAVVLTSTQIAGGDFLTAVACPSSAQCIAVGRGGTEITFNPAAPGTPPIVTAENHVLYGIACSSVVLCVAVDDVGDAIVGTGPPAELSAPTIAGNNAFGQTLGESHGSYLNAPTGYGYQWERCNTAGADCLAIPGATAQTYTLALADVGSTIMVSETASNAQGTGSLASSSPTAVIEGLGSASLGKVKNKKAKVTATVSCTGAPIQICSGTLAITVVEHLSGHKLTATSAKAHRKSKHPKKTKQTVTIGQASYSLTVGAHTQLTVTLNGTGKRLLSRQRGKLEAKLGVIPTGDTTQAHTKTITLKR